MWSKLIVPPGVCRELRVYRALAHLQSGPGQRQACGWFMGCCGARRFGNRKWDGGVGGVEQGCWPGTRSFSLASQQLLPP